MAWSFRYPSPNSLLRARKVKSRTTRRRERWLRLEVLEDRRPLAVTDIETGACVDIDKTGDALSKVGDVVDYSITVTNCGGVESPDIDGDVTDPLLGINQAIYLSSGQSTVINASRTVLAADPDPLVNTATVTVTVVDTSITLTDSATHSTNLFQPCIDIDKSGDALGTVGYSVNYTIIITNCSSADSPNLVGTVSDPLLLGPGHAIDLAPGESDNNVRGRTAQASDPDPLVNTATVTVSPVGFPNVLTESDSHSTELRGIIQWEKRNESAGGAGTHPLQGGATFTVDGGRSGPFACFGDPTNPVTVVDDGTHDVNPTAGQLKLEHVCPGSYIVTETVAPAGFARDDDFTRAVTVASGDLSPVIGTQGTDDDGNSDESDFHNRLGRLAWEKRDHLNVLQGGAKFSVTPNPVTGIGSAIGITDCTVAPCTEVDRDPDAGQLQLINVRLGSYTVVEIVAPAGFALDDDPSRVETVADDTNGVDDDADGTTDDLEELFAVIGSALAAPPSTDNPGDTDESDFHNRLGSIAWEKRRGDTGALQTGATFSITPDPSTGSGSLTGITDCTVAPCLGADKSPSAGQYRIANVLLAAYTVTETGAPAGFALDDDTTRTIIVSSSELNPVVGTQGTSNACPDSTSGPDGNEDDFCNRLGSIAWEKRRGDTGALQTGATFSVTPNPFTGIGSWTGFSDCTVAPCLGADKSPGAGQYRIANVLLAAYTIAETVAPAGFALDDDTTRLITVSNSELNPIVGTQGSPDACPDSTPGPDGDEDDFCNRLGSIAWEKRRGDTGALQTGATFSITPNPFTASGTWTGFGDCTVAPCLGADKSPAAGQYLIQNVLLAAYTITETAAPTGFALEDDTTRAIIVSSSKLNPVVGIQGTANACPDRTTGPDGDEDDFCNRLGSITIFKDTVPNSNQQFEFDPSANLQINNFILDDNLGVPTLEDLLPHFQRFSNLLPQIYSVEEVNIRSTYRLANITCVGAVNSKITIGASGGFDAGDTLVTIALAAGENVTCTFVNELKPIPPILLGSITFIKDTAPNSSVDFEFDPSPSLQFNSFFLDDDAGVPGANNPNWSNSRTFSNLRARTYSVEEVNIPSAYKLSSIACVGAVNSTITMGASGGFDAGDTSVTISLAAGENVTCTFVNELKPIQFIAVGADAGANTKPTVMLLDPSQPAPNNVLAKFLAYEETYRGGVRVALADVNGDGTPEIITAPGRSHLPEIRVFEVTISPGDVVVTELVEFRTLAYPSTFTGGVHVAVGDVDGDGRNDLVTTPSRGAVEVKVFKNQFGLNDDPIQDTPIKSFFAFPASFVGGATVGVVSLGKLIAGVFVANPDGSSLDDTAEIVVGSGPGMRATVNIFDVSGEPTLVRTVLPFAATFTGGVFLDIGRINADQIPDLAIGAGGGGNSQVEVWDVQPSPPVRLSSFTAYVITEEGVLRSNQSPVRVALQDTNGDGVADRLIVAQGTDGKSREIRIFHPLSPELIDTIMESDEDFFGEYFLAVSGLSSQQP